MSGKLVAILIVLGACGLAYGVRRSTHITHPAPTRTTPATATPSLPTADAAGPLGDVEFPKDFFFGTASSDFQTTGGNGASDWVGHIATFKPPQVGPGVGSDFLHHYTEDFDQAREIGIQMHRISLEWARLEPHEGQWDWQAVEQYRRIFRALKRRGIEPMICLNHFTLPAWFAEKGGWSSPDAARYYGRYARFVATTIGAPLGIRWWLTFNEPQITLKEAYIMGAAPPYFALKGIRDEEGVRALIRASTNLVDSHRAAYQQIHRTIPRANVGWASWAMPFYPYNPEEPLDTLAASLYGTLATTMLDELTGRYKDFIGLNYYGRARLKLYVNRTFLSVNHEKPVTIGWENPTPEELHGRPNEFYPQALYDLIIKFKGTGLPIIITENGSSPDEDRFREEFLVIHLKAVHDAIAAGAPVIGYMYWTLSDTWEWGGGFSHFGLLNVDRDHNYARSRRPVAQTYHQIIKTHTLSRELLEKHHELLSGTRP